MINNFIIYLKWKNQIIRKLFNPLKGKLLQYTFFFLLLKLFLGTKTDLQLLQSDNDQNTWICSKPPISSFLSSKPRIISADNLSQRPEIPKEALYARRSSSTMSMNTMKPIKDPKPQKAREIAINMNHSITKMTETILSLLQCMNEYKI